MGKNYNHAKLNHSAKNLDIYIYNISDDK